MDQNDIEIHLNKNGDDIVFTLKKRGNEIVLNKEEVSLIVSAFDKINIEGK